MFIDGAGRVLQSVLPMKAAKNSFITNDNLSEVWFPRTHDQKSLMLCWRSFCHGCILNMQSLNLAQFIIYVVLAAFLVFSFTLFLITTLFCNNTWIYITIISKIPSFGQCSSGVAGSLNPLLLSSTWMLAALPHNWECTNLHQSAYLDINRYRTRDPHHVSNIPHSEVLYENTYIRQSNGWCQYVELQTRYRLGRVTCLVEVELALESAVSVGHVEVHLLHCVSSDSAGSLRCHFSKEGSRTFGFDKALLGVFVSQPSPFCAQETPHPTSVLFGPGSIVSLCDISFPQLQRAKSLLSLFWPYSMPGACRTVSAVPDLLALR